MLLTAASCGFNPRSRFIMFQDQKPSNVSTDRQRKYGDICDTMLVMNEACKDSILLLVS